MPRQYAAKRSRVTRRRRTLAGLAGAAAGRQFDQAEQISPVSPFSLTGQAYVAARLGERAKAEAILAVLQPIAERTGDPFHVAIVYLGLHDKENALRWLGRAADASDITHWRGQFSLDSSLIRLAPGRSALRCDSG